MKSKASFSKRVPRWMNWGKTMKMKKPEPNETTKKAKSTDSFSESKNPKENPNQTEKKNLTIDPPSIPSIDGVNGESEKPRGKYKTRKIKEDSELKPEREDLRPFLQTLSMVLESFHAEPLSETEIETGMNAWFPVWEKYAPAIGDKAVWMFPIVWTASIAVPRIKSKVKSE